MNIHFKRAHLIILFAILFITIGWIAPAAYASYAPQGHFITVDEFSAENVTTDDTRHTVTFKRTVNNPSTATVFTELYLVTESGERVEVGSRTLERYFQAGNTSVKSEFPLPNTIDKGTYRYLMVVEMDLTQGRIQREFVFLSDPFTVAEPAKSNVSHSI